MCICISLINSLVLQKNQNNLTSAHIKKRRRKITNNADLELRKIIWKCLSCNSGLAWCFKDKKLCAQIDLQYTVYYTITWRLTICITILKTLKMIGNEVTVYVINVYKLNC